MNTNIGIRICGTGSCAPKQTYTNQDMAQIVETDDAWIRSRTGIGERHFVDGAETNLELARKAAQNAIDMAGIAPNKIGVCLCATITGDTLVPSLACMLQRELGLSETMLAMDIGAACTGFLFALHTARSLLCTASETKYALVVGSEVLSRIADFTDRSTCVLFGDGAGAAVIRLDETTSYYFDSTASGNDEALFCPRVYESRNPFASASAEQPKQYVRMNGRAVYTFAVHALSESIRRTAQRAGSYPDRYICHQANARIIQAAAKQLGEPMEKFFLDIESYGNTSAASIPLALDDCVRSGGLQRGQTVMLAGFGGGLSSGTAYFTF